MCTQKETPTETTSFLVAGTYSKKEGHVDGKGNGLEVFKIANNELVSVYTEAGVINPTFMDISADGRRIYTANETGPDVDSAGTVSAFEISETGELSLLSTQSSESFYPCHIELDFQDRIAVASNYAGGIAVYPILENGALGKSTQTIFFEGKGTSSRQDGSHPHSTTISPDGKYAYVADLGTDNINMFRIDYTSTQLIPLATPFIKMVGEAGPRHMVFHPTMPEVYIINELNSTITHTSYDATTGVLEQNASISTLPEDFEGDSFCADIHISEDGRYLYGTNRGHNSIAIFNIEEDGSLNTLGYESVRGDHPRNFLITGGELLVANQNTDNIVVFEIQDDGLLQFKHELHTETPVCLRMVEM